MKKLELQLLFSFAVLNILACDTSVRIGDQSSSGILTPGDATPSSSIDSTGRPRSLPYFAPRTDVPISTFTLDGETVSLYSHPRVWVTKDVIPSLKGRANSSNPMWVGLDAALQTDLQNGTYQTSADAGMMVDYALSYLATGKAEHLAAARTILLNFTNSARYSIACDGSTYCGNDNLDYGSIDLMYISAVFDWLYADLSLADRQTVMNWVYGSFIPFLRKHPFYGDSLHNLGHTKWCGEYLWALATLGEDSRADALIQSTTVFWKDQILPILDETFPGGHTYSGSGYGYNRVFKYQLYAFEAAYSALGVNMFADHPWPIDEALYRIHATFPVDGLFYADWESSEGAYNQGRMNENEVILAHRYQNTATGKLAQYFIQNDFRPRAFYNEGGVRVHPIYVGLWFLWYDPALPATDYATTESTAYFADGLGLFMSRSDWHDESAAWVSLASAKYIGDHQLQNPGSFKIFKHEHLVIENGRFYSGQASNLTPVDTNILFIGRGAVDYGEVTGGIYRRETGSSSHVSRFVANDVERIAYARANLGTAYDPSYYALNYFDRSMVHLKPFSGSTFDYVILFDRVKSENAEAKKAFVHVIQPPSISGNVATVSSTHDLSRLFIQNLLPESVSISSETLSDKTSNGYTQEGSDHPSRLVLKKTTPAAQEDNFLSTFSITDNMSAGSPTISRVDSTDSLWMGAVVLDGANNRVVLLSKSSGSAGGTIQYKVAKTAKTQHAIFDLVPDTAYDVSISGTAGLRTIDVTPKADGAFKANGQGVLIFSDN